MMKGSKHPTSRCVTPCSVLWTRDAPMQSILTPMRALATPFARLRVRNIDVNAPPSLSLHTPLISISSNGPSARSRVDGCALVHFH